MVDESLAGLDEVHFEGCDHRSLVEVPGDACAACGLSATRHHQRP